MRCRRDPCLHKAEKEAILWWRRTESVDSKREAALPHRVRSACFTESSVEGKGMGLPEKRRNEDILE